MSPEECPKYRRCSANVCPLDPHVDRRTHLRGERVCLWLREWSKPHGEAQVQERLAPDHVGAVRALFERITQRTLNHSNGWGDIKRVLLASSQSGSRLAAGNRLQRTTGGGA